MKEPMTTLYLVRHGETEWNRQRRIQGSTDIPLNDTGRQQAELTGQLLTRRHWDAIFTSPLSRTLETAQIIARVNGLAEPIPMPSIVERQYGDAEGLDWDEVQTRFPGDTEVPGRESREDVTARVVPALIELASRQSGQSLIVVSHGGVIRSVLSHVDPGVDHGRIANGSVHSFRQVDGELALIAFNDPIEQLFASVGDEGIETQNALEARDTLTA